jgi:ribosomal protein S18 acetylase RimI-like enzyme
MNFGIRYATDADKSFWFSLDKHMSEDEFALKVRDKRGYVITSEDRPVGILRYNLFWDNTPFLTLIKIAEPFQRKGLGRKAVLHWENEMCALGYKTVVTSTQTDEGAQHFYRKLGYLEKGCLTFDNTPAEQPMEILFIKVI